jgi:transcriptional regulator with XRE-family HTH domain
MRLQDIGYQIRQARLEQGLTQAQLADAAKVSRTTLNQLENGLFPDLGVKKLRAILERVGLALAIQPAQKTSAPDFVRMACTTANVSYLDALSEDELIRALLTGKIPAGRRPHFRTLFDEAAPALLQGLAQEVSRWTKPGRLEKNLGKIAKDINSKRGIGTWLKIG